MTTIAIPANYYQQFDADPDLDVPGEGYGGWKRASIELDLSHTGVVLMHALDAGTEREYPGWYRAVEYIPRANRIVCEVIPPLLKSIRDAGAKLFHVTGIGDFYKTHPGYLRAVSLVDNPTPRPAQIESDPSLDRLREFRGLNVFVGGHNQDDVARGSERLDFSAPARPVGDEGIAENADQLFALCREAGVNHLIYAGFAINWCLLLSPGGMADMNKRGVMCSAFRQAVTAVENKETARDELCKQIALWRVALAFGFVFDVDDFVEAISYTGRGRGSDVDSSPLP